jgi:flagellar hook-associated protein 3 FlgL
MIAAAAVTDPGLLSALVGNSAAIRQQLNTALEQQSTGLVSDSYSGLGAGLQTSVNLAPAVQRNQVWQANIDQANATLGVTQSALSQIAAIATNFNAQVGAINYVGVSQVASIAASAKQALQQVADLLNTRSGDVFVFAGQDSANPPLPSTDPAVVGAALLASDTATAPFSTTLGAKTPQVEVGDGQFVSVGVLANQNTLTTSAAPTTGSYMRDIMRSLATLAALTDGPTTQATALDVRIRLGSAITAISNESGALGSVQSGLTARKTGLAATQIALSKQVSNAQDADMAATLTKVAALQTQLQASYQVIAGMKSLSLVNFLPVA